MLCLVIVYRDLVEDEAGNFLGTGKFIKGALYNWYKRGFMWMQLGITQGRLLKKQSLQI